jgi:osmotically-inducible protein OsmY
MKTDAELKNDVTAELLQEPTVTSAEISVATHDGIVTLSGSVPSCAEKLAAETTTQRVDGVKAIAEELEVTLPGSHHRPDAEIAAAIVSALGWHVWVPDTVHATIEDGWVTLTGVANWEFERKSALEAVRYLTGVQGVSNNIGITSSAQPTALINAVEKTVKRDADVDADRIEVSAQGGNVTLTGTVPTAHDRDAAGSAACGVAGVKSVANDLVVSS